MLLSATDVLAYFACVSVRFHNSLSRSTSLTNGGKDMSGIIQLAEALKTNEGLTSLKYARACHKLVLLNRRQQPLSVLAFCSFL